MLKVKNKQSNMNKYLSRTRCEIIYGEKITSTYNIGRHLDYIVYINDCIVCVLDIWYGKPNASIINNCLKSCDVISNMENKLVYMFYIENSNTEIVEEMISNYVKYHIIKSNKRTRIYEILTELFYENNFFLYDDDDNIIMN